MSRVIWDTMLSPTGSLQLDPLLGDHEAGNNKFALLAIACGFILIGALITRYVHPLAARHSRCVALHCLIGGASLRWSVLLRGAVDTLVGYYLGRVGFTPSVIERIHARTVLVRMQAEHAHRAYVPQ